MKRTLLVNEKGLNKHFGEKNPKWNGGNRLLGEHPCPQCKRSRICEKRNSHRICKECYQHRGKKFNWNNWRKEVQIKAKEFAIQYKGGKCIKCEVSDLPHCCYHFHHRFDEAKKFNLGSKFNQKINPDIIAELDKCDLLCANCHALITWLEK